MNKVKSRYQNRIGRNVENVTIEEESDSMDSSAQNLIRSIKKIDEG